MMERICQAMLLMSGGKIGFYRGDVKLLIEDIKALRPTMFVSVPRLLNRVYDKVSFEYRDFSVGTVDFSVEISQLLLWT